MLRVLFMAALCAGCGYRFGAAQVAPDGYAKIAVSAFTNRTPAQGIEHAFSQSARDEVVRSGVLRLVPLSDADAILVGEIQSFGASPVALRPLGSSDNRLVPTRYRGHVRVQVRLLDRETGEVVWSSRISSNAVYNEGSVEGFEAVQRLDSREDALAEIADDVMREAVSRMTADF